MRVMSKQILIFTAAKQRRPPGSRPEGFVNTVGGLDLEWVINVKENQPELLAEAQRLTSGPAKMPPSPTRRNFNSGTRQKSTGRSRTAPCAWSKPSACRKCAGCRSSGSKRCP